MKQKILISFCDKLIQTKCAKFYKNLLSFVEDITKTILVCFFMGHSVVLVMHYSTSTVWITVLVLYVVKY